MGIIASASCVFAQCLVDLPLSSSGRQRDGIVSGKPGSCRELDWTLRARARDHQGWRVSNLADLCVRISVAVGYFSRVALHALAIAKNAGYRGAHGADDAGLY